MTKYMLALASSALLLAMTVAASMNAQIAYARGQDVSPTYDGWEQNPDGS
jgi:hypothetical protein